MTDTVTETNSLRVARERRGYSREYVSRQLEPPISSKTLERWEQGASPVKPWRLVQLASVYEVKVAELRRIVREERERQ